MTIIRQASRRKLHLQTVIKQKNPATYSKNKFSLTSFFRGDLGIFRSSLSKRLAFWFFCGQYFRMKNIAAILAIAFLLISAMVIHLLRTGVSIRSAPIIRPSAITRGGANIAQGVVLRLAPELQNSHYVVWGVLPLTPPIKELMGMIQNEYEALQPNRVTVIEDALNASPDEIQKCLPSCWLFVPQDKAHEIGPNELIEKTIRPLKRFYTTITYVPFSKIPEPSAACIEQRNLSFECLKDLAIHEANRKMKDTKEKYFFMKKHLEHDFFLFIQEAPLQ